MSTFIAGQVLTAAEMNTAAGDSGWTTISSFTNGWTQYSTFTVKYRLIGQEVQVEGVLSPGSSATAAFTLPAGFRPTDTLNRPSQGAGTGVNLGINISPAGVITPSWTSGTPTVVTLVFSFFIN